jgi:hypothetical protein
MIRRSVISATGGAGKCCYDPVDRIRDCLVLPQPHDRPSGRRQSSGIARVALAITCQFWRPIPLVGRWLPPVLGAAVPEAAVHEDGDLALREDNVRSDPNAREVEPQVNPEAVPGTVQGGPQGQLGAGISPPVALHVAASALVQRGWIETFATRLGTSLPGLVIVLG